MASNLCGAAARIDRLHTAVAGQQATSHQDAEHQDHSLRCGRAWHVRAWLCCLPALSGELSSQDHTRYYCPAGTSLGLYTTGTGLLAPPPFLDAVFEPLFGSRTKRWGLAAGPSQKD
jgi:hypothetical protein